MLDLKLTEKICLNALDEICKKYQMDDYYSIGQACEQRVCICKRNSNWEVFIVERGIEFEKSKYKECIDACLELIKCCSYSNEEFIDASNDFKNMLKINKHNKILKKCKL